MNIFFLTLVIFVIVYLSLNWFAKTSSKKISKSIRSITIILAAILAFVMVYAGRFIFSLPFVLMILPLIKTKAGLSLLQVLTLNCPLELRVYFFDVSSYNYPPTLYCDMTLLLVFFLAVVFSYEYNLIYEYFYSYTCHFCRSLFVT